MAAALGLSNPSVDLDELVMCLKQRVQETTFTGFDEVRTDSDFLKKFLRLKNGNIELALVGVKKYYAWIHRNFDYVREVEPQEFAPFYNSDIVQILKARPNGTIVATFRMKLWKPKEINFRSIQLGCMFLNVKYSDDPVIQENGSNYIFDMTGFGFEHVWCFTPREMYRMTTAIFNGFPIRVKGVHFVNPPRIFRPVHALLMRFLNQKMQSRILLHSNFESLHQHFLKDQLPVSFGGTIEDTHAVQRRDIDEMLEQNIPFEDYWKPKFPDNPKF